MADDENKSQFMSESEHLPAINCVKQNSIVWMNTNMYDENCTLVIHTHQIILWSLNITCTVIGWKRVFYQSKKHRAELKLSCHLPNCTTSMSNLWWEFSLVFFFLIERETFVLSKPASSNIRTKWGFVNMPCDVVYVIKVFKVFTLN